MMRNIIVAAFLVTAVTSFKQTPQGGDNAAFLLRCQKLADRMAVIDSLKTVSPDSITEWKKERNAIKTEYKTTFKQRLTDDEAKRYYAFASQYNKRLTTLKANDVGDAINDTGTEVTDAVKRTGKKIQGWIEGLKK